MTLTDEQLNIIYDILRRGNNVELKKVQGEIVIVEIRRQVRRPD